MLGWDRGSDRWIYPFYCHSHCLSRSFVICHLSVISQLLLYSSNLQYHAPTLCLSDSLRSKKHTNSLTFKSLFSTTLSALPGTTILLKHLPAQFSVLLTVLCICHVLPCLSTLVHVLSSYCDDPSPSGKSQIRTQPQSPPLRIRLFALVLYCSCYFMLPFT